MNKISAKSNSIFEKIIPFISYSPLLPALYVVGKWYKEFYFSQFGISFDILNLDILYYVFGSWATVVVTIALLSIALFLIASFYVRKFVPIILSVIVLCLLLFIIFFTSVQFNPYGSTFINVIASKDICLMIFGFISFILLFVIKSLLPFHRKVFLFLRSNWLLGIPIIVALIGLFFLTGPTLAQYHARKAIYEGKMGYRWAAFENKWWILVLQNDNRFFLYDRYNHETKIVQGVDRIDGFVTAEDPPELEIKIGQSRVPIITVLPALKEQVNAETENNGIPWDRAQEKYDIELQGTYMAENALAKTIKGDYSYTLYKFSYKITKVMKGQFTEKILIFIVERQFPTPESHIKFKELWPFNKDKELTFKLRKGEQRYLIESIEQ